MTTEETRPGAWVVELMDRLSLRPEDVAVLTRRSQSTVFRWRKRGIDAIEWFGLLSLLGLPSTWRPGDSVERSPRKH